MIMMIIKEKKMMFICPNLKSVSSKHCSFCSHSQILALKKKKKWPHHPTYPTSPKFVSVSPKLSPHSNHPLPQSPSFPPNFNITPLPTPYSPIQKSVPLKLLTWTGALQADCALADGQLIERLNHSAARSPPLVTRWLGVLCWLNGMTHHLVPGTGSCTPKRTHEELQAFV